jgi:hypothetical protein
MSCRLDLVPVLVKHSCGICGGFSTLQDRIPEVICNHKSQMNMGFSIGVTWGMQGAGQVLFHNFLYLFFKSIYSISNQNTKLMGWLAVYLVDLLRSPPARRSRSPYYRSAGHRLFSLHMSSSRSRGWSNGFEWDSFDMYMS